jgi:hypothetical protein
MSKPPNVTIWVLPFNQGRMGKTDLKREDEVQRATLASIDPPVLVFSSPRGPRSSAPSRRVNSIFS